MNRIYQGKITRIEHKPENEEGGGEVDWEPLPDWEEALWRHHELFQDAVNYYAVCLLALATNSNNPIRGIRNKLAGTDENGNPTPSQVWLPFRRKGVTRPGMRSSVVKYFCPENADATPENCFDAAIGDSPASSDIRNAALVQLLEACKGGGGKIRNAAPEFFPLFCNPFTNANFKADKALLKRKWAQEAMPFVLHDSATLWDSPDMDNFDVHSIGTPDKRTPRLDKEKATARITVGLELLCEKELLCGERKEEFLKILESKPEDFSMPNYVGSSVKGGKKMQMAAMMLYRFVEKSERTFAILRQTIHAPDESQTRPAPFDDAGVTEDPIKVCRGERGYVFRAFTSLDFFEVGDDEGRPCWDKFDFAAFEEALKALHQVEEKTQERQKEKNKNEFRLACMENKAKWKVAGEDEEEPPPILAGDPRVASLEAILEEMADEYESTEGESVAYGMNVRTIRGFRALRDKWNALAKKAQAKEEEISPDALSEILREYQKDNPETIGSVRLFEELLKTDNHLVWKEPAEEEWEQWRQEAGLSEGAFFADDPVRALTDKRLLMRDVERLSEPISFTPADPRYSRRQFYFSDVCDFKPNGQYKHLPNRLQIIVPMVVKTDPNGIFRQRPVRISYSAPRLFRDQLRRESNEMLTEAPFLQPMMEALGVGVHLAQDMHDCAVSLMPDETDDGRKRHLLNFPVDLDTTELQQALGKEETWGKQFAA
ncbi:MAG: type V CRISPR-associated protein Cas12b, partial [Verrucomicrobia bacterium]|nr:type V CRISPR-associated protein Cas12b [Verrucomicrobiota bacterium]